jgi:hypothetical protein
VESGSRQMYDHAENTGDKEERRNAEKSPTDKRRSLRGLSVVASEDCVSQMAALGTRGYFAPKMLRLLGGGCAVGGAVIIVKTNSGEGLGWAMRDRWGRNNPKPAFADSGWCTPLPENDGKQLVSEGGPYKIGNSETQGGCCGVLGTWKARPDRSRTLRPFVISEHRVFEF